MESGGFAASEAEEILQMTVERRRNRLLHDKMMENQVISVMFRAIFQGLQAKIFRSSEPPGASKSLRAAMERHGCEGPRG